MRNHKTIQLDNQLRNLRCPRCGRKLAELTHGGGSVIRIRCQRCKAMVLSSMAGTTFADQDLTAAAH